MPWLPSRERSEWEGLGVGRSHHETCEVSAHCGKVDADREIGRVSKRQEETALGGGSMRALVGWLHRRPRWARFSQGAVWWEPPTPDPSRSAPLHGRGEFPPPSGGSDNASSCAATAKQSGGLPHYPAGMPKILVVADTPWVINDVHAALSLPGYVLVDHNDPRTIVPVTDQHRPDLAIIDLQVGSMGGMAIVRTLREAEYNGKLQPVPVILLLDRTADAFLAKRAAAAAWLKKPFTSHELRETLAEVLPVEEPATEA